MTDRHDTRVVNPQPQAVYTCYDADDNVLYVGRSTQPFIRFYHHDRTKTWWDQVARISLDWHDGDAATSERAAIERLRPAYNVVYNREHTQQTGGVASLQLQHHLHSSRRARGRRRAILPYGRVS
jgi:excinuclease UvrABC nuclease subunit